MCCLLSSTLRSAPFIYVSADYTVFPGESRESKCIHYLSYTYTYCIGDTLTPLKGDELLGDPARL
jgi:hypothetical protein